MRTHQTSAFWMKRTHNDPLFVSPLVVPNIYGSLRAIADGEPGDDGKHDGGGDPDPRKGYVPEHLLKEAYTARDAAKADAAKAAKQTEEVNKALEAFKAIIGDDPSKFSEELKALRDFQKTAEDKNKTDLEKLQAALTASENNHKASLEKLTAEHAKAIEKSAGDISSRDATIAALRETILKSEIYKAAVENNAANPEQIVLMLSGQFELNEQGEYIHKGVTEKGTPVELSVADHCKEFLAAEANANLLASGDKRRVTKTGNNNPGDPGKGANLGKGGGDGKPDEKGKTYLEKLGRGVTDRERSRFPDLSDEEIAVQLYFETKAAEKAKAQRTEMLKGDLLPGQVNY